MARSVQSGEPYPLGASVVPGGVNFSVYARGAEGVELLLFRKADDVQPSDAIALDPDGNRDYHYWHVRVPGLEAGQVYAYRVKGPFDPKRGLRFDPRKPLVDPYARGIHVPKAWTRASAKGDGDPSVPPIKGVVAKPDGYDWAGDRPLNLPFARSVVYEMHVRGFTANPNSGVAEKKRGTYAGMIEKIPYLKDLGITAVELLPVFAFDAQDAPPGRKNYWGYQPISFFAPHAAYSTGGDPLGAIDEFRDLVKALHRAGIEVILDVVFNHTTEGGQDGPTICFRGFSNDTYYLLEPDRARYSDFTGCGNTMNANHPVVRRLILDSLRYWVHEMHVDGFRFDLASILSRDESGHPQKRPPVLFDLESDPLLARTKLIAEAWDAAGLYEVGRFVGDAWVEWNGKFRDDVRAFVKGEEGKTGALATRLLGSPDLYGHEEREAEQSINFVACHDGFTLNDVVSYNGKHNEANGENNRDGSNDNVSWNCGVEGPTDDRAVEALRNRQVKNLLALEFLAIGAPMILMGDEVRHTQKGNNNAYSHDNELSWFDWKDVERHADVLRFTRTLIAARLKRLEHGLTLNQWLKGSRIDWHGLKLGCPDWGGSSRTISVSIGAVDGPRRFQVIANAYWEPLPFELAPAGKGGWRRFIDTALASPEDIRPAAEAPPLKGGGSYRVEGRSVVVLVSGADFAKG